MKTEFAHQYSIYMACSGEKIIKPITPLRKIPCNECQILQTLHYSPSQNHSLADLTEYLEGRSFKLVNYFQLFICQSKKCIHKQHFQLQQMTAEGQPSATELFKTAVLECSGR